MGGTKLDGGITLVCVTTVTLIFSFHSGFAEAKGKARISYSLAQAVCASSVRFARTNEIESPSKTPPFNDDLCKTLTWHNCVKSRCERFKLKNCHQHLHDNYKKTFTKQNRIVNGMDAKPNEFPHAVRMTVNREQHCGGTILNENYIVTAAHCVYEFFYPRPKPYFKIEIIAGEHSVNNSDGTEQFRNVKSAIWHEDFVLNDTYTALNDIALVLLDRPLEFNTHVFPPKLPEPDYEATGQRGTIKGWGQLFWNGPFPDILQKVNLTIMTDAEFGGLYENIVVIPETVVCAATVVEDINTDICMGDSGGALTIVVDNDCDNNNYNVSYLFVGIASYNSFCKALKPSVYTQVSKYLDWISNHAVWKIQ